MNRGNGFIRQPGEAIVDFEIETIYHEPHNDWRRDVSAEKLNESNNFTKTFIAIMLIVFSTGLALSLIDGWKTSNQATNAARDDDQRPDSQDADGRRGSRTR